MRTTKKTQKKKYRKNKKQSIGSKLIKGIIIIILLIAASCSLLYLERSAYTPETNPDIRTIKDLHIPHSVARHDEQIIQHTGFTVSYSEKHRQPYWVSYELTADKTRGEHKRTNQFVYDPQVNGASAHTSDYSRSGYDRGHMAPAGDMKWSKQAMNECFYLSNICPQHPDLNHQSWNVLENRARNWAVSDSAIIIICGPIIHDTCRKIGTNKVSVPDGFFKVILSPYVSPPQAIGFLFKNKKSVDDLRNYAVPVDSVEVVTGLDFFHQLPDSIEAAIEAEVNIGYWEL
ncbi:DNA/RNA non-specific endonuclease [Bacteroides sp. 519]|uniref:DNA/RNA non-specific endonuclease n=1 Tax=Bacteroides sp. 519 TaxID=2302937 RepID=UPI0013D8B39A|nr:DNA/RNA non-specific endonuclease [Bacteroides sp. 519]NDV60094.1 DNA/RNA non-specific endonuclease [Bacteroides sp. 519]